MSKIKNQGIPEFDWLRRKMLTWNHRLGNNIPRCPQRVILLQAGNRMRRIQRAPCRQVEGGRREEMDIWSHADLVCAYTNQAITTSDPAGLNAGCLLTVIIRRISKFNLMNEARIMPQTVPVYSAVLVRLLKGQLLPFSNTNTFDGHVLLR